MAKWQQSGSKWQIKASANPAKVAKSMNDANKDQMSEAVTIQAYANSVSEQPEVDFEDTPTLKSFQTRINDGLNTAKLHSSNYLAVIQPQLIQNMTNIGNYYALHNSVGTNLPPGSTLEEWNEALASLQSEAVTHQREAKDTAAVLNTLFDNLTEDVGSFSQTVSDLNTAVEGDNGVLNSIDGQLDSLQGEINGIIAGVVVSGLTIVGGVIMIVVGSISQIPTGGFTFPLIVGGVGIVVSGIGGGIGASVSLAQLFDKKAKLLTEENQLKEEVKLALGIKSGYTSLLNKVKDAASASLRMENAWKALSNDLGTLITDLQNGLLSSDQVRSLFLTEANDNVQIVIKDIETIKAQMEDVTEIVAKKGQTVSELIIATAEANQSLNPSIRITTRKTDSVPTSESVATEMNTANKKQTSQALLIEAYARSVNEQPMVDFSGVESLLKFEKDINSGLKTAQDHANTYLEVIQPAIISNITNIGNYYAIHDAVASSLPAGSTEKEWLDALTALETQSKEYQANSNDVVKQLLTLNKDLTTDAGNFKSVVTELNAAIEGDNGVLDSIRDQLKKVQSQLDGAISGTVLSALAAVGGLFLIGVGSVAEFVTAGTSTPVVLAGIAIVATGVVGETASAIVLQSLNNEKAELLTEKADLKSEIKLATGIEQGYESLSSQVGIAVDAATSMLNAWEFLSKDLGSMISDLEKGITNTGTLRKIFLTAANTTIKVVIEDIQAIKQQMEGVETIVAKKGQTVGDAIVEAVEEKQKVFQLNTLFVKASPSPLKTVSGALSQSVANLRTAEHHVKGVTNLPSAAQTIQSQSLANIPSLISQIGTMQDLVGTFVKRAIPQLNDIVAMLTSNQPLKNVNKAIESVRGETSNLNTIAVHILAVIQDTTTTMYGYFNQLAKIKADINDKNIHLQGQLESAKGREKAAKKKYYYLNALGAYGAAGLAGAGAIYKKIKSEVNGLKKEISSMNSQIASLNAMQAATDQLGSDFRDVTAKMTGVKNSVSFVSNDVLNVESDLSLKEARIVIEIAVKATITEVETLSIDALGSVVSA